MLDACAEPPELLENGLGYRFRLGEDMPAVEMLLPRLALRDREGAPLHPQHILDSDLADAPPLHLMLLVQAGHSALGLWEGFSLLRHTVIRKYVVRGNGRAQPLHRKTRGKSRYGSRLRLREAEEQLEETNARTNLWLAESHHPPVVHLSCPVRLFADLIRAEPLPTFHQRACVLKIPHHVHRPNHEEMLSVHRLLSQGAVRQTLPAPCARAQIST